MSFFSIFRNNRITRLSFTTRHQFCYDNCLSAAAAAAAAAATTPAAAAAAAAAAAVARSLYSPQHPPSLLPCCCWLLPPAPTADHAAISSTIAQLRSLFTTILRLHSVVTYLLNY